MAIQMSSSAASGESPALVLALQKRFPSGFALDVASTAAPGITILFGASGAGKTTILESIAGLLTPDRGHISCGARVLFDAARGVNVPVRKRGIGYVFQDLALFPHLSVFQNVQYGLLGLDYGERRRRVDAIVESFRIGHLRDRKPGEISGGERQRVALARTLVTEPSVLLLDEPLAALDGPTKSRIMDDLRAWNLTHRIPILYVTHSREEVFALGERVVAIGEGMVLAAGTPREVLAAPRQETVAQLAGFENIFDATVAAVHEEQGTMSCRVRGSEAALEIPLGHMQVGDSVRVGIHAGDILLASVEPQGLSARNLLPGTIVAVVQRDVTVVATVDCGLPMVVHLTPAARDALGLTPGRPVWLVVKTHSCHLLRP